MRGSDGLSGAHDDSRATFSRLRESEWALGVEGHVLPHISA